MCIRDSHTYLWYFNGDLIAEYKKHTGKINYACFVSDGNHVLTASDDGYVMRWRTPGAIFAGLNVEPVYKLSKMAVSYTHLMNSSSIALTWR